MGEHRQKVDHRVSMEVTKRVWIPVSFVLGARHIVRPYHGSYDDAEKTHVVGFGHKDGGDKRHRSSIRYVGINYPGGGSIDGLTRSIEVDRRIVWSVKHDNRLVQNDETRSSKVMTFDEEYDEVKTEAALDIMSNFSGSGTVLGIGGSVSGSTHSHIAGSTFKYNKKKTERIIDTSARICYPGPVYRDDITNGIVTGRTLVQEGPIWLVERPVATVHTITPVTQWGVWDARMELNLYDWAGNYGILPKGEHKNKLTFSGFSELISFLKGDLILQYKWSRGDLRETERRRQARP